MKKIIFFIVGSVILFSTIPVSAQTLSGRTVSAVVADVLTQLPADRSGLYDQLMLELIETETDGVIQLVSMLNMPGKGDNSAIEYALNGMALFSSNDENLKSKMEQAVIAAFDATNEHETKAFLIRLLTITGSDASINKLAGYLSDDRLCSPAANAMAAIGGMTAGKTLQMELMRKIARSPEAERSIIQALGDATPVVEGTEALLKTMINTGDVTTKGIVLKALSKTGSKQSLPDLAAAAAITGYHADLSDAGGSYVRLIKRVYEQGDTKEALDAAQNLMKNATKAGSTQLRTSILEILFYNQKDMLKTLKAALKDGDKVYRNAALRFASDFADKTIYSELLKSLPKVKTAEKIDVLFWIGNEAQCPEKRQILKTVETGIEKTGLQTLTQLLNDPDIEVQQAAVIALGAIGDPSTLPALTELLKRSDTKMLACFNDVLASFTGDIFHVLTRGVSQASDEGKIVLMELLSVRKANTYFTLVLELSKNTNPAVRNKAFEVLKDVVSEKDFIVMCGMLETAEPSTVTPLQHAISSSISSLSSEKQTEMISHRLLLAGDANKYLYYPVLSSTHDPAALAIIVQGINEGDSESKTAAFEALISWEGFEAEEALYDVCRNASAPFVEKAVDAYISCILNAVLTDEKRHYFLLKAMEIAKTDAQKNRISSNIGQTGS